MLRRHRARRPGQRSQTPASDRTSTMASRKGLTADGSTRSWREARDAIPGPKRCVVCGTTKNLQANHIKPRKSGGSDSVSNLEWRCVRHQTYVGRPKGS